MMNFSNSSATGTALNVLTKRVLTQTFFDFEKAALITKLRAGRQRAKAERGRCEGQKPYGHYFGEAVVLARMRQLRAQGMSCRLIALRLAAEGHRARSGGLWHGPVIARILRRDTVTLKKASSCASL